MMTTTATTRHHHTSITRRRRRTCRPSSASRAVTRAAPPPSFVLATTLLLLAVVGTSQAFVKNSPIFVRDKSRSISISNPASLSSTTTQRNLLPMPQWDDVVYNAQAVAGNLATSTLEGNPTNLWTSLPIMYGAGLLTSCSPCVWGLLPLTMSYISTAAGERQDKQTTLPTLAFAAGLALVFCSLGVAAAELGGLFGGGNGNDNSNTAEWLALVSNSICFAMGLKLLELIDLPLPNLNSLFQSNNNNPSGDNEQQPILLDATGRTINTNQSSSSSNNDESGSLVRTFLLGGSSALVASPCATPVLTSILAYVATAHNAALGALLLLGYTLGYSTPLLWIAATGGQALVQLKQQQQSSSADGSGGGVYATIIAPWITPLTAGILLWYGTGGILTALWGDPSYAALAPILE